MRLVLLGLAATGGCGAEMPANGEGPVASTGIRFLADGGVGGGPAGGAADGFARAVEPRPFRFPADHGAHPNFRTEWWYFTGNVLDAGERHYGFELTFFRIALSAERPESPSAWATNQVWMAHFTLSDTANEKLVAHERLARGALGLAGAGTHPFEVWVEDWSVRGEFAEGGPIRLLAQAGGMAIDLRLTPRKPPVPQGEQGLDRKGPERGNASYYYSIPRLAVQGTVRIGDTVDAVHGSAWMDREWATSALSDGIAGWDWFALELSDGRDLMFYRLRRDDGTASPFSGGTLIDRDGSGLRIGADEVELNVLRTWRSRVTGVEYPVAWRLRIPQEGLELTVRPYFDDQEVRLSVRYWEGAVRVGGSAGGEPITGRGYLELAGY